MNRPNPISILFLFFVCLCFGFMLSWTVVSEAQKEHQNGKHMRREITSQTCTYDNECGHGVCMKISEDTNVCACNQGWQSRRGQVCSYRRLSAFHMFIVSAIFGGLGLDWCVLARGHGGFICLGILKALTLGGFGVWYFVDIGLNLGAYHRDGNGVLVWNDV